MQKVSSIMDFQNKINQILPLCQTCNHLQNYICLCVVCIKDCYFCNNCKGNHLHHKSINIYDLYLEEQQFNTNQVLQYQSQNIPHQFTQMQDILSHFPICNSCQNKKLYYCLEGICLQDALFCQPCQHNYEHSIHMFHRYINISEKMRYFHKSITKIQQNIIKVYNKLVNNCRAAISKVSQNENIKSLKRILMAVSNNNEQQARNVLRSRLIESYILHYIVGIEYIYKQKLKIQQKIEYWNQKLKNEFNFERIKQLMIHYLNQIQQDIAINKSFNSTILEYFHTVDSIQKYIFQQMFYHLNLTLQKYQIFSYFPNQKPICTSLVLYLQLPTHFSINHVKMLELVAIKQQIILNLLNSSQLKSTNKLSRLVIRSKSNHKKQTLKAIYKFCLQKNLRMLSTKKNSHLDKHSRYLKNMIYLIDFLHKIRLAKNSKHIREQILDLFIK